MDEYQFRLTADQLCEVAQVDRKQQYYLIVNHLSIECFQQELTQALQDPTDSKDYFLQDLLYWMCLKNHQCVPLEDNPELLLLDPVNPLELVLELVEVPLLEVLKFVQLQLLHHLRILTAHLWRRA